MTPDVAQRRRRLLEPRRWSLRTKLLAVLALLLALVCAAVGWITVVAAQRFLVDRLDAQLGAAGGRSVNAGNGGSDGDQRDDSGTRFLLAPGQAAGTLGARVKKGAVNAVGVLDNDGVLKAIPAAQVRALTGVKAGAAPRTLEIADLGDFRVAGVRAPDGDVIITGLPLREVERTVHRIVLVELIVAGAGIVVATAGGALVIRRTLRPLRRVAGTATRVSALPLSHGDVAIEERIDAGEVDAGTEVGQVAGAVNRLLDHVDSALTARQQTEMKIRRFVADASHELRTPLTAIRGYAELTRPMRDEAPPTMSYAMERVESEAQRMTTMVEDLLMLARLDAGRELAHDPVDLIALLLDVVSDVVVSSRDHEYELDLPDEPVEVVGDSGSLHQVFANLLANTRVHTPPGTRVVVGLRRDETRTAVVTVRDNGPGIPPEVLPAVFERFARGTESRSRDSGTTGLGLAIVQAIVDSHGGTVGVVSAPGETVFTVRLPLRQTAETGASEQ